MRRRVVILALVGPIVSGFALALALAASGDTSTGSSDATVLMSTTYQNATPEDPQGMSPAAAAEVRRSLLHLAGARLLPH